jgi:hypothetical protein
LWQIFLSKGDRLKNQKFFNRQICAEAQICRILKEWRILMTEFEYKTIVIDSKETEHSEKPLSDKLNHYGSRPYFLCWERKLS